MRIKKRKIIPLSLCVSMILALNINAEEKTVLEEIKVSEDSSGYFFNESITEGTNSYTTRSMNTSTKLDMSIRETPQSVKVITNQYLEDTITPLIN